MHPFDKCIGIELLQSLFQKSVELKDTYEQNTNTDDSRPTFEVFHGDLLEFDWWSNADIVLANSTCFEF